MVLLLLISFGLSAANVLAFLDGQQRATPAVVAASVLGAVDTQRE